MGKCITLLACILFCTMIFSGCSNKKEKENAVNQSEDIIYDYEMGEQGDAPNVEIVPNE